MQRDASDTRVNPDLILKAIEKDGVADDTRTSRGHLKIFFGYAAGTGKTYAMLQAAHAAKRRGVDVVAGYIEPHERPATAHLAQGLENVPCKLIEHNGIALSEFDLDAAIERAPQLILVDELAHTNAPGSRHDKRYQDVEELLHAGIDVYTTVNVQHIESLNDMVASITGVVVSERIPDRIFDDADQVELVDIEPEDLLERLRAGLVYRPAQADRAQQHFFTVENLTALREIALRRCADRTGHLTDAARVLGNRDYYTRERILVCVSPAPTNPRIVRAAARMAKAFRSELVALFVESPRTQAMSDDERAKLAANIALAEQLGAHMETVYGDDIAFQISEFARLSGISKIVMGRTGERSSVRQALFGRKSLVEQLIAFAPNLDIYIIPEQSTPPSRPKGRRHALALQPPSSRNVLRTLALSCRHGDRHGFPPSGICRFQHHIPLYLHGPADRRHHDGAYLHDRIERALCSALQLLLRHASVFARQLRPKLSDHVRHHVRHRYGRRRVNCAHRRQRPYIRRERIQNARTPRNEPALAASP